MAEQHGRQLAGRTIAITTKKNLNAAELAKVVEQVFRATECTHCTSGGNLILREETQVTVDPALNVSVAIS